MGRSAGNDSGRSVFGGPPSSGGSRSSCGSWPEVELPSSRWGLGGTGGCGSADGLERLGPQRLEGVKAAPGERRSSGGRLTHGCVGPGRQSCIAHLWKELVGLVKRIGRPVYIEWVRGKSSTYTKRVDKLAKDSARRPFDPAPSVRSVSGKRTSKTVDRKASLPKVRCSTSKCGCGVPAAAAVLSVQVRSHVGGQPIRQKCGLRTQR
jgi:hypothetical protein